jgi:hypothetical protein
MAKIHNISQGHSGVRLDKKLTKLEKLEVAVRNLANMPQFLLQNFQNLIKVVEDVRFTYEVIGRVLQDKNLITQEELTAKGNLIIAERKKIREEKMEKVNGKENSLETEEIKSEVARELMQPREDLKDTQVQDKDVSIKEIK